MKQEPENPNPKYCSNAVVLPAIRAACPVKVLYLEWSRSRHSVGVSRTAQLDYEFGMPPSFAFISSKTINPEPQYFYSESSTLNQIKLPPHIVACVAHGGGQGVTNFHGNLVVPGQDPKSPGGGTVDGRIKLENCK
jgi:hypothetical protein